MKLDLESPAVPGTARLPGPTPVAVPVYKWHGKPERMAWIVLWGAFLSCVALSMLVPFLGIRFVRFSTEPQSGALQAAPLTQEGITPVRVYPPNVTLPLAVTAPAPILENSRIETDQNDNSRAFLTFFDGSTAFLFKNTQLLLQEMRRPRFAWSEMPNTITVVQQRGAVRYGIPIPATHAGNPEGRPLQFLVRTPRFDAWLNPGGSYSLIVGDSTAEIAVRDGSAIVRELDTGRATVVGLGQRVMAEAGKPLAEPVSAAQDLLANGDFASLVTCDPNEVGPWRCYSDQGGDGGEINGSVGVVTVGERRAVQIKRADSNQNSAITGIRQLVDRDVSDYRTLKLSADVRVESHNLSGGGYQSSEYPLILRIRYKDVNGDEAEYVRGFYVQNDTHNPTLNGELVPRGQWIPFDSSNLLASLPVKPFRILSVEVYASGWDYESYVSNVQLTAE